MYGKRSKFHKFILALSVLIVAIAIFFVPFETQIIPRWNIQVLKKDGTPQRQIRIRQFWEDYSLETEEHEETRFTDERGLVVFPARYVRASLWQRGNAFFTDKLKRYIRESSSGVHSLILLPDHSGRSLSYDGTGELPSEIVLD